jgi:hypothetical protein
LGIELTQRQFIISVADLHHFRLRPAKHAPSGWLPSTDTPKANSSAVCRVKTSRPDGLLDFSEAAVFVTGADPLKFGFGARFNKPGANITGIWMVLNDLAEKRLQLLHDLVPTAESIALLVNPTGPVAAPQTRDAEAGARTLGVRLRVLNAVTENV